MKQRQHTLTEVLRRAPAALEAKLQQRVPSPVLQQVVRLKAAERDKQGMDMAQITVDYSLHCLTEVAGELPEERHKRVGMLAVILPLLYMDKSMAWLLAEALLRLHERGDVGDELASDRAALRLEQVIAELLK